MLAAHYVGRCFFALPCLAMSMPCPVAYLPLDQARRGLLELDIFSSPCVRGFGRRSDTGTRSFLHRAHDFKNKMLVRRKSRPLRLARVIAAH
ncbi:hypothetical protein GGR52DRAFT_563500 [Hypoxylon sp. FL1284]|nr:hypothetical protein GGR52DRAFT_563500 [Hypoxylon sp. FL1284]